jgi:hypothetical protein
MSNHFDNYQIHYTSIIFVHSFEHHQPQYLLVAPTALLRTVVEAILQNILFSRILVDKAYYLQLRQTQMPLCNDATKAVTVIRASRNVIKPSHARHNPLSLYVQENPKTLVDESQTLQLHNPSKLNPSIKKKRRKKSASLETSPSSAQPSPAQPSPAQPISNHRT